MISFHTAAAAAAGDTLNKKSGVEQCRCHRTSFLNLFKFETPNTCSRMFQVTSESVAFQNQQVT